MILAVAFPTWLQVGSTAIAAIAAGASWAAVVQARKAAQAARDTAAESFLPLLLVSRSVTFPGAGNPTFALSVYNAGGGVAQNAAVMLVVDQLFGRHLIDFLRPGETATFGSTIDATGRLDESRAFVYAVSQDGRHLAWDDRGVRHELKAREPSPFWDQLYALFSLKETLAGRQPVELLRGDTAPLWPAP